MVEFITIWGKYLRLPLQSMECWDDAPHLQVPSLKQVIKGPVPLPDLVSKGWLSQLWMHRWETQTHRISFPRELWRSSSPAPHPKLGQVAQSIPDTSKDGYFINCGQRVLVIDNPHRFKKKFLDILPESPIFQLKPITDV